MKGVYQLQLLAPVVVSILKQASAGCPPAAPGADIQITPALLLKEASYNAVGAAYYDLHDYIDFKSWCVDLTVVIDLPCFQDCMPLEQNKIGILDVMS